MPQRKSYHFRRANRTEAYAGAGFVFGASVRLREALLLGLVFEMTVRPEGSSGFVVLGVAALLGVATGTMALSKARRAIRGVALKRRDCKGMEHSSWPRHLQVQ